MRTSAGRTLASLSRDWSCQYKLRTGSSRALQQQARATALGVWVSTTCVAIGLRISSISKTLGNMVGVVGEKKVARAGRITQDDFVYSVTCN